jgi:hypothetical protein
MLVTPANIDNRIEENDTKEYGIISYGESSITEEI